jgi:uncharacterized protein (TIGR00297 family)
LTLVLAFYLSSSKATKYKEDIKSKKTKIPDSQTKSKSDPGSQSQRTHVQVLSNSITASVLILISIFISDRGISRLLKAGIIGQYVAVQADTWSSELGILSTSNPFLITTFETVPPGTNGGVTKAGLLAGLAGSALISAIAAFTYQEKVIGHFLYFTVMGVIGTLIDSILGAILQYSIIDRDGLILEPIGGVKIDRGLLMRDRENLKKVSGEDVLSNNQVNVVMAFITSLLSIGLYEFFF